MPACVEVEEAFAAAWADPGYRAELVGILADYGGRPTPVTECRRLSERLGLRVLLEARGPGPHRVAQAQQRDRPGPAHPADGQAPDDRRDRRRPARRGHRHRGRAARSGVHVFMGEVDMHRQELNVFRMELLGAEVRPVRSGSRTLKDAVNEAMREWVATVEGTHYCLGSVMGPHPSPTWCASSSGWWATRPASSAAPCSAAPIPTWWWPAWVVGPTPRGPSPALSTPGPRLVGVEAAGGAAITTGIPGVLHGMHSQLLQDENGQILEAHSISAGLDYPGIGPEHAHLAAVGRATYEPADDDEVLAAFQLLAETEGIIPALESAHALAWVVAQAGRAIPAGPPC